MSVLDDPQFWQLLSSIFTGAIAYFAGRKAKK